MNEPSLRLPPGAKQLLWAVCHTCKRRHPIWTMPGVKDDQVSDWLQKHPLHEGHRVEFRQEDPLSLYAAKADVYGEGDWLARVWGTLKGWWRVLSGKCEQRRFDASLPFLNYDPNADDKIAYGSSAALTISLASLATSSTLLAGRESTAVNNTSNLYYDYQFGGYSTVGTTPTINTYIGLWYYAAQDDTPTYPSLVTSGIAGSDGGATAVTAGVRDNSLTPIALLLVDATTSNRQYNLAPLYLFGGCSPKRWGAWAAHSTAVNLNSTGGNHVWSYHGQYGTS